MAKVLISMLEFDKKIYFIFLCLISFLLLYIKVEFIEKEIAAFEVLEQKGEMALFTIINTLKYLSIPLIYLFKFTITAFIIWIGCFMFGYKLTFSQLWGIVLICETVFIAPELIKITYFFTFVSDPDYFNFRAFYPLSLIQLFDYQELADKWHYPLKALNAFEVLYWFIIIYAVHYTAKKKLNIAYNIIFSSYVLCFFLWLGFYVLINGN